MQCVYSRYVKGLSVSFKKVWTSGWSVTVQNFLLSSPTRGFRTANFIIDTKIYHLTFLKCRTCSPVARGLLTTAQSSTAGCSFRQSSTSTGFMLALKKKALIKTDYLAVEFCHGWVDNQRSWHFQPTTTTYLHLPRKIYVQSQPRVLRHLQKRLHWSLALFSPPLPPPPPPPPSVTVFPWYRNFYTSWVTWQQWSLVFQSLLELHGGNLFGFSEITSLVNLAACVNCVIQFLNLIF